MRLQPVLGALLVAAACVASGSLECGGRKMTEAERHGAAIYGRMCSVCHGASGEGYAADSAPAIANAHFLATTPDWFLRTSIANGRSGTTMSAWSVGHGGPLGLTEVNQVVAYLRSFERLPQEKLDESPLKGDAPRGAAIFAARCVSCHGEGGTGGPYVHIGGPDLLGTASNGQLRATIREGRPGTLMPAFGDALGREGVDDVVAALRDWQAKAAPVRRPPPPKPPPLPLGPVPLHPRGPEPVGFNATPATTPADVVKRELDRGAKMALLDARASSDYINEHIQGAVSVPFYDPRPYLDKLPRDAWLVCYCACPHAESGSLARDLAEHGFTKVTVLDEGLPVWKMRKYPTSAGLDP
jgi:cytochrome c oxidase cbb3-type subunit 3/ubiquinol-cytochrome c reductase cytochrome c subunit